MAGAAFGVATLDRAIGPIPKGGTVLLRHDPSVEALPFLLACAASQLRAGEEVVFVATTRSPSRLLAALQEQEAGVAVKGLLAVDAYSALVGAREAAAYRLEDTANLSALADMLATAARDHPKAILLVESLSALVDHAGAEPFLLGMPRLLETMRRFRFAAALFTAWSYGKEIEGRLRAFDAQVDLKGVEERVVLNQVVSVARTPWTKESVQPSLYKVARPGGILLHIPKIVVLGPHGAGKTSFVHALSDKAISVERMGTTVALDRATVTLGGVRVEVFGTPGQDRFDPLLPMLAGQASGAVLLVDATQPQGFDRAKEMLQKVWRRGLRVVIALNKQDLPGALRPEASGRFLRPPAGVTVLGCSATKPESVRRIVQQLVDRILAPAPENDGLPDAKEVSR
ncbi:MAG TPA: GTP-binding protein [Candidatus Thermoplasmatota archaeon]|nr:GTP-binding protein [Candidatus Thermoplasmatota archaeon]